MSVGDWIAGEGYKEKAHAYKAARYYRRHYRCRASVTQHSDGVWWVAVYAR